MSSYLGGLVINPTKYILDTSDLRRPKLACQKKRYPRMDGFSFGPSLAGAKEKLEPHQFGNPLRAPELWFRKNGEMTKGADLINCLIFFSMSAIEINCSSLYICAKRKNDLDIAGIRIYTFNLITFFVAMLIWKWTWNIWNSIFQISQLWGCHEKQTFRNRTKKVFFWILYIWIDII